MEVPLCRGRVAHPEEQGREKVVDDGRPAGDGGMVLPRIMKAARSAVPRMTTAGSASQAGTRPLSAEPSLPGPAAVSHYGLRDSLFAHSDSGGEDRWSGTVRAGCPGRFTG